MRRSMSIVASLVIAAGLIVDASPGANAATCSVANAAAGTTYANLQEAVDASADGDTVEVRGTCVGRTVIQGTRLRLKGVSTPEHPTPTLDGAQLSRVLTIISAKVVIRDITITKGEAKDYGGGIRVRGREPSSWVTLRGDTSVTGNTSGGFGGGIRNEHGTLILNDSASVTGNTTDWCGGIWNMFGTVILNDSASVTGNTGGGICTSRRATVILNDSASVTGNAARRKGGGIWNSDGIVALNDSASVTGNTSGGFGGGIFNGLRATLILNDSASVTGNTAAMDGGGIRNPIRWGGRVFLCSDEVAISPNDPDDPPKVRHVCP